MVYTYTTNVIYSGHVVTMKCVEEIIKPSMICPLTDVKLNESDIIQIVRVSQVTINTTKLHQNYLQINQLFTHTHIIYYRVEQDILEQVSH